MSHDVGARCCGIGRAPMAYLGEETRIMKNALENLVSTYRRPAIGGALGLAVGVAYWVAWGCRS
jgi:hypothetical protein